MNKKLNDTLINQNIKALKVRIISIEGNDLGIVDRSVALTMAKDAGLDLVQLSETDGVPLVKIMDFGKNLYSKKKKMSEGKKKQKVINKPHIHQLTWSERRRRWCCKWWARWGWRRCWTARCSLPERWPA